MKSIKKRLHQYCTRQVDDRILTAQKAIQAAREAANDESKSSMGDKYETGRAMMQLEQEKYAGQLSNAIQLKKVLEQINPEKQASAQVELGSLVKTNYGYLYLSVSLGQIALDDLQCFAVSPVSPIGKTCLGLQKGDTFTFNGRAYRLEEVG
ncbi:3-oxoacyl-ACP synthase [Rapidithrix thailandica]|uniref:3-oxoacyl-ACP synthase n=1 Tax=Rapidithrix thailandica TaxID=413964 RepID=A0AAW9SA46_9BACT